MKIAGKKCVINCTAPVKVANKFVRDMLSKLKIICPTCGKTGIKYNVYVKHMDACVLNQKISTVEELNKTIKEKQNRIDELKSEMDNVKINGDKSKSSNSLISVSYKKEELRNMLMTFGLTVQQKMELYNAAVEGRLNEFKSLVNDKKYPLLEEVSAHNYYWTPLHYAMHYGQYEIINFILTSLNANETVPLAMKLLSDDGRCPLLCLLRSNSLSTDKKKDILDKTLAKYDFEISSEVKKEIRNRDMDYILKKHNKI
jgi:ssDNA-binding Zn-finger/Zn-ribbon topoisomerase 1